MKIPNRTNLAWKLRPVVTGEYWSGPDTFNVDPQSSSDYDLMYKPLTMTTEGKKHQVRKNIRFTTDQMLYLITKLFTILDPIKWGIGGLL